MVVSQQLETPLLKVMEKLELKYLHWFLSRVRLRLVSLADFVLLGILTRSVGMVRVHVVGVVRS